MRLLLIRHGQTPSNVAGALDTAFPGAGLTPLGQAQAAAVPAALAAEEIVGVYASPLVRTQLTAAPLAAARGLDVVVRAGLEEISAGEHEMRSDDSSVAAYVDCLVRWMNGDLEHRLSGGESGTAFLERYDAAIHDITGRHDRTGTVAVFSHGAAIRVWAATTAGLDPEVATELRVMNTGMAVLDGDPDAGWELTRWSSEPLGGAALADAHADDVTGESTDEAAD